MRDPLFRCPTTFLNMTSPTLRAHLDLFTAPEKLRGGAWAADPKSLRDHELPWGMDSHGNTLHPSLVLLPDCDTVSQKGGKGLAQTHRIRN